MNFGIGFSLLVFGIGLCAATPAINEKTLELHEVQSKVHQVDTELKNLAAEKNAQLEQLKKLEKQYGELVNALIDIKTDINQQEAALQETRSNIAAAQRTIQAHQHSLEGLIKSAYVMGNQDSLKLLLNQHDPGLPGRMLVYHDYISKARVQRLAAIQEDFQSLKALEDDLHRDAEALQAALVKKQQETDAMQVLKIQREKLLTQVNNNYQLKNLEMDRLIHDQKKLEALLASLQKTDDNAVHERTPPIETSQQQTGAHQESPEPPPHLEIDSPTGKTFPELQGNLPWPVPGVISEHFGSRRFETSWDGAVISAKEGADIHAIAAGRVVFADWLRGYGLMLIVDHGKGYMSLYAFNQSLHRSVGEQIKAGEVLASVGRSGGRSQAALYFGIRINGRPVNPEHWCKKSGKG